MSGRKRKCISYKEDNSSDSDNPALSESYDDLPSDDSSICGIKKSVEQKSNRKVTMKKGNMSVKREIKEEPSGKDNNNSFEKKSLLSTKTATSSSIVPASSDGPPVTTDASAKKLVLQYMREQNRPYSLIQIHDNLHKRIPKATLERVMAILSGPGGEIVTKEYGKSKIYYLDQTQLSSSVTSLVGASVLEAVATVHEENAVLHQDLDTLVAYLHTLMNNHQVLTQEPSDTEMDSFLQDLKNTIERKEYERDLLIQKINQNPDPNMLFKSIERHNRLRQVWIERKRVCMDAVDTLGESMGKKNRDIMDLFSVETDEDAAQLLPPLIKAPDTRR